LTGTATLEELPEVFRAMLTRPAEGTAPEIKTAIYPVHAGGEYPSRAPELTREGGRMSTPQPR
jgi:hypothetical protein